MRTADELKKDLDHRYQHPDSRVIDSICSYITETMFEEGLRTMVYCFNSDHSDAADHQPCRTAVAAKLSKLGYIVCNHSRLALKCSTIFLEIIVSLPK